MTDAVLHHHPSALADTTDPDRIQPSHFNEPHDVTYGAVGDIAPVGVVAVAGAVGLPADAGHVHVDGGVPSFAGNRWYGPGGLLATGVASDATLFAFPFVVAGSREFDRIGVYVVSHETGATVVLAVYEDLDGLPGALIFQTAELDCDVADGTAVEAAYDITLTGRVWIAARALVSTFDLTFACRDIEQIDPLIGAGSIAAIAPHGITGYSASGATTLPDPFGSPTEVSTGNVPAVFLRAKL